MYMLCGTSMTSSFREVTRFGIKMSNETGNVSWKYMMPYLLYGYMGKKVSYASSIGNMSDEDLLKIIPEVEKIFGGFYKRKRDSHEVKKFMQS